MTNKRGPLGRIADALRGTTAPTSTRDTATEPDPEPPPTKRAPLTIEQRWHLEQLRRRMHPDTAPAAMLDGSPFPPRGSYKIEDWPRETACGSCGGPAEPGSAVEEFGTFPPSWRVCDRCAAHSGYRSELGAATLLGVPYRPNDPGLVAAGRKIFFYVAVALARRIDQPGEPWQHVLERRIDLDVLDRYDGDRKAAGEAQLEEMRETFRTATPHRSGPWEGADACGGCGILLSTAWPETAGNGWPLCAACSPHREAATDASRTPWVSFEDRLASECAGLTGPVIGLAEEVGFVSYSRDRGETSERERFAFIPPHKREALRAHVRQHHRGHLPQPELYALVQADNRRAFQEAQERAVAIAAEKAAARLGRPLDPDPEPDPAEPWTAPR